MTRAKRAQIWRVEHTYGGYVDLPVTVVLVKTSEGLLEICSSHNECANLGFPIEGLPTLDARFVRSKDMKVLQEDNVDIDEKIVSAAQILARAKQHIAALVNKETSKAFALYQPKEFHRE